MDAPLRSPLSAVNPPSTRNHRGLCVELADRLMDHEHDSGYHACQAGAVSLWTASRVVGITRVEVIAEYEMCEATERFNLVCIPYRENLEKTTIG